MPRIKFTTTCEGCTGDCCSIFEIIQLSPEDIIRISAYLDISPVDFAKAFVAPFPEGREKEFSSRGAYSCCLKRRDVEQEDGSLKSYCCFYYRHPVYGARCAIHAEKPTPCQNMSISKCEFRKDI